MVDWENQPCTGPGRVIAQQYHDDSLTSRFVKAALQKRGFTAWVDPTIKLGHMGVHEFEGAFGEDFLYPLLKPMEEEERKVANG